MSGFEMVYDKDLKMFVPKGAKRQPFGFARAYVEKEKTEKLPVKAEK